MHVPNAPAKLRASQIENERSEQSIDRSSVQRSLGLSRKGHIARYGVPVVARGAEPTILGIDKSASLVRRANTRRAELTVFVIPPSLAYTEVFRPFGQWIASGLPTGRAAETEIMSGG